jgi:hypothetical protein
MHFLSPIQETCTTLPCMNCVSHYTITIPNIWQNINFNSFECLNWRLVTWLSDQQHKGTQNSRSIFITLAYVTYGQPPARRPLRLLIQPWSISADSPTLSWHHMTCEDHTMFSPTKVPFMTVRNLVIRRLYQKSWATFFLHAAWEQQTKESTVVGGTSCCVNLQCLVTSIPCITWPVSLLTKWPTISRFTSVLMEACAWVRRWASERTAWTECNKERVDEIIQDCVWLWTQ